MTQIFVNQKYRKNGNWVNNVHVKEAETADEAVCLAKHQFHAFMSTYAYGQDEAIDYASCSVEDIYGVLLMQEVDNRIATEPVE